MKFLLITIVFLIAGIELNAQSDNLARMGGFIGGPTVKLSDAQVKSLKNPIPKKWNVLSSSEKQEIFSELKGLVYKIQIQSNSIVQCKKPVSLFAHGRNYSPDEKTLSQMGLQWIDSKVSAIVAANTYLIKGKSLQIEVPQNSSLCNGDVILGVAISTGVFEYAPKMGAVRRIPTAKLVSTEIDFKDLELALRNGQSFVYIMPIDQTCPKCKGFRNYKIQNKTVPCNSCQKGKISERICFSVSWN